LAAAETFEAFAEQVLPFDTAAAQQYALVVTQREGLGLPIDGFDAQIAAIWRALASGAAVIPGAGNGQTAGRLARERAAGIDALVSAETIPGTTRDWSPSPR
jgi:hypothetical protein